MVGEVGDTMRPSLCVAAIEAAGVVGGRRSERDVGGRVVRSKRLEPRVRAMEEQHKQCEPAGKSRARLGVPHTTCTAQHQTHQSLLHGWHTGGIGQIGLRWEWLQDKPS